MTDVEWSCFLYVDGWRPGKGGTSDVVEVATGERLGVVGLADASDVDAAVAAARPAQREWAGRDAEDRARRLEQLRDVVHAEAGGLTEWLVREAGATRQKAVREIKAAEAELLHAAELARAIDVREVPSQDRRQTVRREPVGIVAIITPFNAPLVLAMRAIAPALAVGNAVILKPDPRTAVSGGLLYPALLDAAGIPGALLSVLPGGADVGERMSEHPDIQAVLFTGSTGAGRRVGEAAGRTLKRIGLELGGNNPVVVLDDADVTASARYAVTSSFLHSGQICMAAGQYFVHHRVYAEFLEQVVGAAAQLKVGDPWRDDTVDMGPVIDDAAAERLRAMVLSSVADGADLRCGGMPTGRLFPATVLADVDTRTPAWCEEAFGPVAPIRPFSAVEEVVRLVEGSEFGLVAAIHGGDVERARALADRLPIGTVRINDVTNHDDPRTPMVGWKNSGNGAAFGGTEMLDLVTAVRLISVRS